jgi:hypothetical protein
MTTLSTVRTRRHRLLGGGQWIDFHFGGWAGNASGRGRVGGRHIFDAMTQIRSVAFGVGRGTG